MNQSLKKTQNGNDTQERFPLMGLSNSDFKDAARKMADIIVDYTESLKNGSRPPIPDVKPGFMKDRLEANAPELNQDWNAVFKDIEKVVFDGSMHWQSTGNLGYFPTASSYPSLLADMLCGAISIIGFTWSSGPACTELEMMMMDWLGRAINLPECFLHDGNGSGGGVIQSTASESTLMTLLSARTKCIQHEISRDPALTQHEITARMVAYASKCSHSSVERAGKIAMVEMRLLDFDENVSLRGKTLLKAIEEDRRKGKIPLYVCATLGTTSCCTFDNLEEIGEICRSENIWLHVDAAFAGSSFLCPEFRYLCRGVENANSFNFNPHKMMMVSFDCSALWVRSSQDISNSLKMNPVYLQHENQDTAIDYMHWQIPLGRRFRSIKLWFVLRMIGLEGLRDQVRSGVERAKYFENLVRSDERFEVLFPVTLALVCFRLVDITKSLQEVNDMNKALRQKILAERRFFLSPSEVNGVYFLRVSSGVCTCTQETLKEAWDSIQEKSSLILSEIKSGK